MTTNDYECPRCGSMLNPEGQCIRCPYDRNEPDSIDASRPTFEDLAGELRTLVIKQRGEAEVDESAGTYLLDLFGPEQAGEHRRKRYTRNGSTAWDWPYRDRMLYQTRIFVSLDKDDQRAIVRLSRQYGMTWRGEDIDFFAALGPTVTAYRQQSQSEADRVEQHRRILGQLEKITDAMTGQ